MTLNQSNRDDMVQQAIGRYEQKNMQVDALFWSQVTGMYREEIRELHDAIRQLQDQIMEAGRDT